MNTSETLNRMFDEDLAAVDAAAEKLAGDIETSLDGAIEQLASDLLDEVTVPGLDDVLREERQRLDGEVARLSALLADAETRSAKVALKLAEIDQRRAELNEQRAELSLRMATLSRVVQARKRLLFELEQDAA